MNERPVAAQVRARTALGVVVLACIAALAAEAGVIAAGIVGSYGRGAAPPAADRLVRQGGSGPASFADVVDAVRPAVVGVQTKTSGASDDPNSAGASHDRLLRSFDAPQIAPLGARRPARVVTSQGSGFFISADGYLVTNQDVARQNFSLLDQYINVITQAWDNAGDNIPRNRRSPRPIAKPGAPQRADPTCESGAAASWEHI